MFELSSTEVPNLHILTERAEDRREVRSVNTAAFGRADEAGLVEALHAEGAVLLSIVAAIENRIAGHILFSRMHIETDTGLLPAVALAPVAVLPEFQRRGIGSRLIQHGIEALRDRGERILIVLGHPEYYSRFGFSVSSAAALASPFPPEAYMAMELAPGALDVVRGTVRYAKAFGLQAPS
jgi:putative acetyltransferase